MLKHISILLLISACLFLPKNSNAQVVVTAPTKLIVGSGTSCSPVALGNIVIKETTNGDFVDNTSNVTYIISLPTGFEFGNLDETSINVNYSGTGGASGYTSGSKHLLSSSGHTNKFSFSYTCTGSADVGTITISGIKVSCYQVGAHGYIYRTGGTAAQNSNEVINAQIHGELDSRLNYAVIANTYKPSSNYQYLSYQYDINGSTSPVHTQCTGGNNSYYFYLTSTTPGSNINKFYFYEKNESAAGSDRIIDSSISNYASRYYYPSYSLNGIYDYYVLIKDNIGCYFSSLDTIRINHLESAPPGDYVYNYTDPVTGDRVKHDTIFAKSDDPKLLNGYINYSDPNFKVVSYFGPGVENLGSGTYLFTPGIAPNNVFNVSYVTTNTTCTTSYVIPQKFTVYDPSEAPASWIQTDHVSPPFCENIGDVRFKIVAPSGYYIQSFFFYDPSTNSYQSFYGYNYALKAYDKTVTSLPATGWYSLNTITMKSRNVNSVSIYAAIRKISDDTYFNPVNYYERTSISIFPKRGVKIQGLPKPLKGSATINDSTIFLCGSSKDTLYTIFGPENGRMEFYKVVKGVDLKMTNPIGFSSSSDPYFRKIIPNDLFVDSCKGDTSIYIKIKYRYPGSSINNQCPDSVIRTLKFFMPIDVNYSIIYPTKEPYCHGDEIHFWVNKFTSGDKFYWSFGDGYVNVLDSTQKKVYKYARPGEYTVRFKTDIQGLLNGSCNNDIVETIRVGAKPKADFDIYKNFLDTMATFISLSNNDVANPSAKGTDKDDIYKWSWDFGTDNVLNYVDETDQTTQYTYNSITRDPYPIIHKVQSGWGCVDSIIKPTPIFTIVKPKNNTTYSEDFNDLKEATSWYSSGSYNRDTLKSSWVNSVPKGSTIKGSNPVWSTMLDTIDNSSARNKTYIVRYQNEEISWVESPVFNLDSLTMPMLSLDTWVNSDNSFDGVCLQYAICDNVAFGREQWKMVGEYDKGVGWYNSYTVISRPTEWNMDGWSGTDAKAWTFSANDLDAVRNDMIAHNKKSVRFRLLFTSNKDNFPNKNLDGFAFDNFFLGQRNRKVVVEEFCDYGNFDTEDVPFTGASVFNDNQTIRIQYHTATFVNDDSINITNPDEPGARSLFYGIGEALPRGVIDGILYDNSQMLTEWAPKKFESRALMISPFTISLRATKSSKNDLLNISARVVKDNKSLVAKNYVVQIAIVEDSVMTNKLPFPFTNVLRNLLPNAAGNRIDQSISWTDTTITRSWKPFAKPSSNFKIIAFIQDEDTKEIYQANQIIVPLDTVKVIANSKSGYLNDQSTSFNEMYINPIPVTQDLRVFFNGILNDNYKWTIIDSYGRQLMIGNFNSGMNAAFINAESLSSGIYQLQMEGEGRVLVEKFAVVR